MQIYYPSLLAIEQQTRQLDHEQCNHCKQTQQLVSHGYLYQKQPGAEPQAVGKRVLCSNRNHHTGCGRTMRLYLDATVRYLHYVGAQVIAFVMALIAGVTVGQAYGLATGCAEPRNAYRWLKRLAERLSSYRRLGHQPVLLDTASPTTGYRTMRLGLLATTFNGLLRQFGQPLCANYQGREQRSFL